MPSNSKRSNRARTSRYHSIHFKNETLPELNEGISFQYLFIKTVCVSIVALYVLNQQHLLPYELSKVVSQALFWPTLPITVMRRIGKWKTVIDDTVVLGGAPFAPWMPRILRDEYGIKGVLNLCDEYKGPLLSYNELGLRCIRLKTVDHFEPTLNNLIKAVRFIKYHQKEGSRVYVHCRAGHGRSAAVVFAWLLYCYPESDPEDLNRYLCRIRDVRTSLWKQPNIQAFRQLLLSRRAMGIDICDPFIIQENYESGENDFQNV